MMYLYLPPGGVLFEEDDFGDSMYVIMSGQLNVRSHPITENIIAAEEQILHPHHAGSEAAVGIQQQDLETTQIGVISVENDNIKTAGEKPSGAEKSSAHKSDYWIGKYFLQARTLIKAQEEISGSGNLASPLASIYAAKWRQKKCEDDSKDAKDDKPDKLTGRI